MSGRPVRPNGFLLLELILAMGIVACIAAAIAPIARTAIQASRVVRESDRLMRAALLIAARLPRGRAGDWVAGVDPVRIFSTGEILGADGTAHPPPTWTAHPPAAGAAAVSVMSLASNVFLVRRPVLQNGRLLWPLVFCVEPGGRTREELRAALKSRTYFGLSVDGGTEFTGTPRTVADRRCVFGLSVRVHLIRRRDALFSQSVSGDLRIPGAEPAVLIPIREVTTYALDRSNVLRAHFHLSRTSQPLVREIGAFTAGPRPQGTRWLELRSHHIPSLSEQLPLPSAPRHTEALLEALL